MDENNKKLFREDLIFLDVNILNKNDMFDFIYNKLFQKKIVKSSWLKSVKEREGKYPTGLPTEPFGIAIPHCNPEHVNIETVSIIRFKNEIEFIEMGKENIVKCKFAFVITMKGARQVSILSDLMALFQDEKSMELLLSSDKQELIKLINEL